MAGNNAFAYGSLLLDNYERDFAVPADEAEATREALLKLLKNEDLHTRIVTVGKVTFWSDKLIGFTLNEPN